MSHQTVVINVAPGLNIKAGIGVYVRNLYAHLQSNASVKILGVTPHNIGVYDDLKPPQNSKRYSQYLKYLPFAYLAQACLNKIRYTKQINKIAQKDTPILYHETNFILSTDAFPAITTIHDLSHIYFPECHPKKRRQYLENNLYKTIIQSKHIIAVSDRVRNEIIKEFNVPADKITAIPHGVSEDFHPRTQSICEAVLNKYQLNYKKYLLCVATLEPRKNLMALIKAYSQLPLAKQQEYPLVLVGDSGWGMQTLDKQQSIRYLGFVSEDDCSILYAAARAFAYISLYEGFGLPVLEAMASGTPVMTSINTPMADFAQDKAIIVSPYDLDAIKNGLLQLLQDESLQTQATLHAPVIAHTYTWEKTAEKTMQVYQQVFKNG
jgi:glycosyltransferase involved in cell wall biosynthesis